MRPAFTVMTVTLPLAGVSWCSGNGRCHGTRVIVPFHGELPYFLMPLLFLRVSHNPASGVKSVKTATDAVWVVSQTQGKRQGLFQLLL